MITSIHKISNIHEFYNKLARVVRTLVKMKKLGSVREVLVQKGDKWEEWGLEELTKNLQLYVERNPLRDEENNNGKPDGSSEHPLRRKENLLFRKSAEVLTRRKSSCVYCHLNDHFSTNCTKVIRVELESLYCVKTRCVTTYRDGAYSL